MNGTITSEDQLRMAKIRMALEMFEADGVDTSTWEARFFLNYIEKIRGGDSMKWDPELYDQLHFKWQTIGNQFGVSPKTIKRWCIEAGIVLPHWKGIQTEPVMVPKRQIGVLVQRFLNSTVRRKLLLAARRKKLPFLNLL